MSYLKELYDDHVAEGKGPTIQDLCNICDDWSQDMERDVDDPLLDYMPGEFEMLSVETQKAKVKDIIAWHVSIARSFVDEVEGELGGLVGKQLCTKFIAHVNKEQTTEYSTCLEL